MDKITLRTHKRKAKRLWEPPAFKVARRNRLPKPLHQIGGARTFSTDMIAVAENYRVCFAWRNGNLLVDTSFYGWLFEHREKGLFPLAILHYHPSHKPAHLLTPCQLDRDFTNRQLPGAAEFYFPALRRFDPRVEVDRAQLIDLFCHLCGISMGDEEGLEL